MSRNHLRTFLACVVILLVAQLRFRLPNHWIEKPSGIAIAEAMSRSFAPLTSSTGVPALPVLSPWKVDFSATTTIEEGWDEPSSMDPYFWLNSGARFLVSGGIGSTLRNKLSASDPWVTAYRDYNSLDTDAGTRPQNIFRLLTRSHWKDFTQEAVFKIKKLNMTTTPQRKESNGLLLMNRYVDEDNLYYAGIRVDGTAVIKKKFGSVYYPMAQNPLYASEATYNVYTTPNLLPGDIWIGLRSTIKTNANGTVTIQLFVDKLNKKQWVLAATAVDDGINYGGPVIDQPAMAGIRTDFMDVQFDNYRLTNL
jgi:hypothetical protein